MRTRVLLIGGIDPSGGAGLTLDAFVVSEHQGQPLPVAVVLTVQNRSAFQQAFIVPVEQWLLALEAAVADGELHAVKVGLLGDAASIAAVGAALKSLAANVPIVVDPVLSATAGGLSSGDEIVAAYLEHLVPIATVVTPNLPECDALFRGDPRMGLRLGARAVLVKGGHGFGDEAEDLVVTPDGTRSFGRPRRDVGEVRGTGCALASAIAARLGDGVDVVEACDEAGEMVAGWLEKLGPPPADGLPRTLYS